MKSRNTRSQMSKNRATLNTHCAECDKPINKTQTGPDFCQHDKSSSHRASTDSKRPTRNQPRPSTGLDNQTNVPLIRSRKNERTIKNLNIPSDQVDSLAVSVADSSKSNKEEEIVILDSSNEEEDSQEHYYAGHQSKNSIRQDKFTLYKDCPYQNYADSDTDTKFPPTKETQKETNKSIPSSYKVDSLLDYTSDDFRSGTGSVVLCPSNASNVENEHYHERLKELDECSTQEKYTIYSNYYNNISHKDNRSYVDNRGMEVLQPPHFSLIQKSEASARISLSRKNKKPLHSNGPSNASPSHINIATTPLYTRKLPRSSSSSHHQEQTPSSKPLHLIDPRSDSPARVKLTASPVYTRKLPKSSSSSHHQEPAGRKIAIPKLKLKLDKTDVSEKNLFIVDKEPHISTRSRTIKPAPCVIENSSLAVEQEPAKKPPVTRKVRLPHSPTKASSKKPLAIDPVSITTARTAKVTLKPNPELVSSEPSLPMNQEPTTTKSKRRTTSTRRARPEPYAAANQTRRVSSTAIQDSDVSPQDKNPPSITKQEPAVSSRKRTLSSVTFDSCTKNSARVSRSASKRNTSLSTGPTEPVAVTSDPLRDSIVEARPKKGAVKRKASLLAETPVLDAISHPAGEPRCKSQRRSPLSVDSPTKNRVARAATNRRSSRRRSSGSFIVDLNVLTQGVPKEEEEAMLAEIFLPQSFVPMQEVSDEELLSAEEEETDPDYMDADEEKEDSEHAVLFEESTDYLRLIQEDPVLKSLRIDNVKLTVYKKVLGEGQAGMVYAGTYGEIPVACKTKRTGVVEEDFYFQIFKEMSFAHKLSNCRNTSRYFGWTLDGDKFYLVQRLVENGDARKYLYKRGNFYPSEVLTAGVCLFSALTDAHAVGIGIVDLKLENFLIDSAGCGFLTDFGSCVEFHGREEVNLDDEEVPWTKSVAAPEMVSMQTFTKASDVFMGTLILAELMTAQLSDTEFKNKVLRRKAGGVVDFSSREISAPYSCYFDLLSKGLQCEASSRPSAEDMLYRLIALKRSGSAVKA